MMKKILLSAFVVLLAACAGHDHGHNVHEHEHTVLNATKYSDSVELFVQYDELMAGHKASVVAYVTSLPTFKPYDGGAVKVSLAAGCNNESFMVEPAHKGVYEFTLEPHEAAVGNLLFTIDGRDYPVHVHIGGEEHGHDSHAHGHSHESHDSHEDTHAHEAHSHDAGEHPENTVSFSKEQSWKIDFATAVAENSSFGGAVKVAARVAPTPNNFTTVVATTAGRVQFAGNIVEGKAVAAGEALFVLDGSNVTDNDAAVKYAEAESDYLVAKSNFARKSELYKNMIVSQREYEEAQAALTRAEAKFYSMQQTYSQGNGSVLKAPYAGALSSLLVGNGDYVQAGTPLAVVQRAGAVNIVADVPMRHAQVLGNIVSVNIETSRGKVYTMAEAGACVTAVGRAVNNCAMLPVTVTANNVPGLFPGSIVTLHIASGTAAASNVVLPRTALVEEMGNYFVFVQHTPVSFEKREVEPGATDGVNVQILKGVHAGERVVTKGGVSLKLSQGAAALDPHAGHVH